LYLPEEDELVAAICAEAEDIAFRVLIIDMVATGTTAKQYNSSYVLTCLTRFIITLGDMILYDTIADIMLQIQNCLRERNDNDDDVGHGENEQQRDAMSPRRELNQTDTEKAGDTYSRHHQYRSSFI
jgi:hypothetical protein